MRKGRLVDPLWKAEVIWSSGTAFKLVHHPVEGCSGTGSSRQEYMNGIKEEGRRRYMVIKRNCKPINPWVGGEGKEERALFMLTTMLRAEWGIRQISPAKSTFSLEIHFWKLVEKTLMGLILFSKNIYKYCSCGQKWYLKEKLISFEKKKQVWKNIFFFLYFLPSPKTSLSICPWLWVMSTANNICKLLVYCWLDTAVQLEHVWLPWLNLCFLFFREIEDIQIVISWLLILTTIIST